MSDANHLPGVAQQPVKPKLAYASTNEIAACRCGSFPTLYGDGAKPDDGYRSLWCQTCMEHVTGMMPNEREVIDHWNDLREKEHDALNAAQPPAAPVETAKCWGQADLANFIRWFMCCERGEAAEPLASGGNGIADRMAHAILTGEVGAFAGGPYAPRSSAETSDEFAKDCDLLTYLNGKAIHDDGRVKLDISFAELEVLRAAVSATRAQPQRGQD